MVELTSVHHRMPAALHKKLKLIAIESRMPITDIMNQAAREWIERYEAGPAGFAENQDPMPSLPSRISALRIAKRNGDFHSAVAGLSKSILIDIAKCLKLSVDNRISRDSAVAAVYDVL